VASDGGTHGRYCGSSGRRRLGCSTTTIPLAKKFCKARPRGRMSAPRISPPSPSRASIPQMARRRASSRPEDRKCEAECGRRPSIANSHVNPSSIGGALEVAAQSAIDISAMEVVNSEQRSPQRLGGSKERSSFPIVVGESANRICSDRARPAALSASRCFFRTGCAVRPSGRRSGCRDGHKQSLPRRLTLSRRRRRRRA